MGTFVFCLLLTVCSINCFHIFKPDMISSVLQTKSDSDVFPLKEGTITDLGIKPIKILTNTNVKDCLKTCQRTEGCLSVVHCKPKDKCDPGTFCLLVKTSTCYLAAKTGLLKPTGTCTEEVNLKERVIQAAERASSPSHVKARPRLSTMNKLKTATDELIHPESLKVSGGLRIKSSGNQNELATMEYPKVNGFSWNLHSEKPGKLVDHESAKEDDHEKLGESMSQDSPTVDGILENTDVIVRQDSLTVDGLSDINYHELVDGGLGNINTEKLVESPKIHNISENIEDDKLLKLVGKQTPSFKTSKEDSSGANKTQESQFPEECKKEPTYVNQGAVRKRKFNRPGYPVVIEYECDETAKEKYKYLAGPREALCDENGTWTLPAMFCNPTSCFSRVADSHKAVMTLYGGDSQQDLEGLECQAWVKDEPHSHSFVYKSTGWCYGCGSAYDLGNRCRTKDDTAEPWCYTIDPDVRWNTCDIPECEKERKCSRPPYLRGAPALRTMVIGREVHVTHRCHPDLRYMGGKNVSLCNMETGIWEWSDIWCSSEKCFHFERGRNKVTYHGKDSTTKTGEVCQRWDVQRPHKHTYTASQFPGATHLSELGNMCQDPGGGGAPWCYTTNPSLRWQYCSVPECALST